MRVWFGLVVAWFKNINVYVYCNSLFIAYHVNFVKFLNRHWCCFVHWNNFVQALFIRNLAKVLLLFFMRRSFLGKYPVIRSLQSLKNLDNAAKTFDVTMKGFCDFHFLHLAFSASLCVSGVTKSYLCYWSSFASLYVSDVTEKL